jgi:putative DNA primase/helicase
MSDLRELKQRFDKVRLLALAETEGLTVRGGKMTCPRRCSDAPDSASVSERDGTALWHCHRCDQGGDVFSLLGYTRGVADFKEQLRVVEQIAGLPAAPARRRGPPPAPPIAHLWDACAGDDPAVRSYLASRGLEAALDRGLCRCSVGRASWYWLDRKASEGYRLAMALRDREGRLVSLSVRAVVPLEAKAKRMLNCASIPSADTAFGDVASARTAPRVYLSEGIADTLALQLAGVVAVGAPGVDSISALPRFCGELRGREVVLCPQNDPDGSRASARAALLFAAAADALRVAGARVLLLRTPDAHKDPAEWLQAAGLDAFTAAVRDSPAEDLELQPAAAADPSPASSGSGALDTAPQLAEIIALPRRFPLTDTGNAERLVALHGEDLRYCHDWKEWLVWDGARWRRDSTSEISRLAKATVRTMRAEFDRETERRRKNPLLQRPDEYLFALGSHAKKSESADRRRAMVALAAVERAVSAVADELDAQPLELNVKNGTLNLETGELREHERSSLHTRVVQVAWDPAAECPRWTQFLDEIFLGNQELLAFVQRAVGYSLTGLTLEQVFFFCFGSGENGKTAFLSILQSLIGEYALSAAFETFTARESNPGAPRPDLVRLRGARLVTASEPDQNAHFSESLLKLITGEDPLVARTLNEREQQFLPVLKLWLIANHQPRVSDASHGFWRRVRLIPFDYLVPAEKKDPQLTVKLRAELPGILRWAVEGCIAWRRNGLGAPRVVIEATQEYRSDMDVIGRFLEEACESFEGSTPVAELYAHYEKWARNSEITPLSKDTLSKKLKSRGVRRADTDTVRKWKGIRPKGAIHSP